MLDEGINIYVGVYIFSPPNLAMGDKNPKRTAEMKLGYYLK